MSSILSISSINSLGFIPLKAAVAAGAVGEGGLIHVVTRGGLSVCKLLPVCTASSPRVDQVVHVLVDRVDQVVGVVLDGVDHVVGVVLDRVDQEVGVVLDRVVQVVGIARGCVGLEGGGGDQLVQLHQYASVQGGQAEQLYQLFQL